MSALSKTLAGDLAMENTQHNNVTRVEGVDLNVNRDTW